MHDINISGKFNAELFLEKLIYRVNLWIAYNMRAHLIQSSCNVTISSLHIRQIGLSHYTSN